MPLDAAVLADIREWVGPTPPDADVEAVYDRKSTVEATALSILRTRRAGLLDGLSALSVQGDYSEQRSKDTLAALDRQIAVLESLTGATSGDVIGVAFLEAAGPSR